MTVALSSCLAMCACSVFNLIVHLLMKSDHETIKLLQFLLNCASLTVGQYQYFPFYL